MTPFETRLPRVGESLEAWIAAFQAASVELKTDFRALNSKEEALACLLSIRDAEGWKKIASHSGSLTRPAADALRLPVVWTDGGYEVDSLESCDAGLTECDALVAQTGGIVVTSKTGGGRALSVLPPHHVVLASKSQLVRDLPSALALIKERHAPNFPSMISFITGPSRTGDIERILVLGAHGPKKLTVLIW